jgi:hypothetical protein
MKFEAKKTLIKPEPVRTIIPYTPYVSLQESKPTVKVTVPSEFSPICNEKTIGVLFSNKDKECGERIISEIGGTRVDSPLAVFGCKYIIWVVSADGYPECSDVLDMATLYPEKLIIFWWRAMALEAIIDVSMMNTREIHDSAFAFFPTNGTYISGNFPQASFTDSLQKMAQWIKQGKNPQGQRVKCHKFY